MGKLILELFIMFLGLTLTIIIASKFIEAPGLQLTGYMFLFLLGLIILFGGLQYKTGEVSTTTPVYASGCALAFPQCSFGCDQTCNATEIYVVNNTLTTNYVYSTFTNEVYAGINLNHILGFFLCIISALGFAIQLMNLDKFKLKSND